MFQNTHYSPTPYFVTMPTVTSRTVEEQVVAERSQWLQIDPWNSQYTELLTYLSTTVVVCFRK